MSEQTSFGALLRRYRTAAGLTQEALAMRAQISARTIADLERGINRLPRHETFELLASALGLTGKQRDLFLAMGRPDMLAAAAATPGLSHAPLPPTALVGREREVRFALTLLRDQEVRLLTVCGPAGVGKTHLGLHLAQELGDTCEDGVVFVPLAPLRDGVLVPGAIAHALGLSVVDEGQVVERVVTYLRDKRMLLLLDNFEHLPAAAGVVANLLAHCPRVSLLVTSRTPLRLRTEHVLPLAPLPLADAMTLFQVRARAVHPDGVYSETDLAAICERLDRLPLAIELAVPYVKLFSLAELSRRLDERLALLRRGASDLPERQRTMEAAIRWSYDLLSEPEQRYFRALGVFSGGWSLEAGEAVCPQEDESAANVLPLAALLEASLIYVERTAQDVTRFGMLEVIREFALHCLREAGEEETVRRRHAEYFAHLGERVRLRRPRPWADEVSLVHEIPNVRGAMQWADERQEVAVGLRLARFSWGSWFRQSQLHESERWLHSLLDRSWQCDPDSVPLLPRAEALYAYGQLLLSKERTEQAEAVAHDALERARCIGDDGSMSSAFGILGQIAQRNGRLDDAEACFVESDEHAQRGAFVALRGITLRNLAEIARLRGDLTGATARYEHALAIMRETGMQWGMAMIVNLLGHLSYQQREYALAKARYQESLALLRHFASPPYTAWCLESLAATLCAGGSYRQATRLCAAAATLRSQYETPLPPAERDTFDQVVAMARDALEPTVFDREWERGTRLTQEEAIAEALVD